MNIFKKICSVLIALSLVFSMSYFEGANHVYADEAAVYSGEGPLESIRIANNNIGDLTEELVTNTDSSYQIALPDTITKPPVIISTTDNTNYYQLTLPDGSQMPKSPQGITKGTVDICSYLMQYFNKNLKVGKKVENVTLKIGHYDTQSKLFTDGQEYNLSFVKKVMLDSLAVESEGVTLSLSGTADGTFNKYSDLSYSVVIPKNAATVSINAAPKTGLSSEDEEGNVLTAGTCLVYGNAEEAIIEKDSNGNTTTFDIAKLPKENDTPYIPITLSYRDPADPEATNNVVSSNYKVRLQQGAYYPDVVITNETKSYEYERGAAEVAPLVLGEPTSEQPGTINYQWQVKYPETGRFRDIEGANANTYTPSTEHVYPLEYRCMVTNTVEGIDYISASEAICINIIASTVSEPKLISKSEDLTCYKGETKTINCSAQSLDYKGELTFQWYSGSGELITEGESEYFDGNSGHDGSQLVVPTMVVGEYEYYCVITNQIGGTTSSIQTDNIKVTVNENDILKDFGGEGTEASPYQINSEEDLVKIRELVNGGSSLEGLHFKLMQDVTLSDDWIPIGGLKQQVEITETNDGTNGGANVNPFMGTFDGSDMDGNIHKITIPKGGLPLFKYVRKATIKNLDIYGEEIAGSGLITDAFIDYGESGKFNNNVPWTVRIDNVTLLNGSKTKGAGFLPGGGSGSNRVTIMNSTVEEGVVIGYEGKGGGGSFVNNLNGSIINCVSYATVNGSGGIAGGKGQSMGSCEILNCGFFGTVNSSSSAGGIIGHGYDGNGTAPNTPVVTVQNCYVVADITGQGAVGGIIGTEPGCECCWANGTGTIANNYFYGTLNGTTDDTVIGGITGFLKSYNKYQGFDNNYYFVTNGNVKGIGQIETIITKDHEKYGASFGLEKPFVESEVCIPTSEKEIGNGELAASLNAGTYSTKSWIQGEKGYPVLSSEPVPYQLELSGNYKTSYNVGEAFSSENMVITAVYTDGTKKELDSAALSEVIFTGFSSTIGKKEIKVRYGAAEAKYSVTVLYSEPEAITVSFRLLGDKVHDSEADGEVHTYAIGGLETWVYDPSIEIDQNTTVWDVLQKILRDNGMTCSNPTGNYVESITRNGETVGEFTNGNLSGWMYTLNGTHSELGVSEQYLSNGDRIVFHYTDDYTKEEGSEHWGGVPFEPEKETSEVTTSKGADGSTNTTTTPTEVKVSGTTATATITDANVTETIKQATENKSAEIVVQVSESDTKGAETVKVQLNTATVKSIVNDTDAALTVKTENGTVTLDAKTLETVAAEAKGSTITLEVIETKAPTAAQKEALGEGAHMITLVIKSGDKIISEFKEGQATVKVEIPAALKDKKVTAVHITDDGKMEHLGGKTVTENGKTYHQFTTPHFSDFALVDAEALGLTDELTADEVKALLADLTPVARSAKTAKKNVKVTLKLDEADQAIIDQIEDAGYTVKYNFYRSTKKSSKYQSRLIKDTTTYTQTGGKKGTYYYYKARVQVYDAEGKLIARTALKQCKYANRKWTK